MASKEEGSFEQSLAVFSKSSLRQQELLQQLTEEVEREITGSKSQEMILIAQLWQVSKTINNIEAQQVCEGIMLGIIDKGDIRGFFDANTEISMSILDLLVQEAGPELFENVKPLVILPLLFDLKGNFRVNGEIKKGLVKAHPAVGTLLKNNKLWVKDSLGVPRTSKKNLKALFCGNEWTEEGMRKISQPFGKITKKWARQIGKQDVGRKVSGLEMMLSEGEVIGLLNFINSEGGIKLKGKSAFTLTTEPINRWPTLEPESV